MGDYALVQNFCGIIHCHNSTQSLLTGCELHESYRSLFVLLLLFLNSSRKLSVLHSPTSFVRRRFMNSVEAKLKKKLFCQEGKTSPDHFESSFEPHPPYKILQNSFQTHLLFPYIPYTHINYVLCR